MVVDSLFRDGICFYTFTEIIHDHKSVLVSVHGLRKRVSYVDGYSFKRASNVVLIHKGWSFPCKALTWYRSYAFPAPVLYIFSAVHLTEPLLNISSIFLIPKYPPEAPLCTCCQTSPTLLLGMTRCGFCSFTFEGSF